MILTQNVLNCKIFSLRYLSHIFMNVFHFCISILNILLSLLKIFLKFRNNINLFRFLNFVVNFDAYLLNWFLDLQCFTCLKGRDSQWRRLLEFSFNLLKNSLRLLLNRFFNSFSFFFRLLCRFFKHFCS